MRKRHLRLALLFPLSLAIFFLFSALSGCGFGPGTDIPPATGLGSATGGGSGGKGFSSPVKLSAISPAQGSTKGGDSVTITGSGFDSGTVVTFGGTQGTQVVASADGTSLTVTTPAHSAAAVDVQVTNGGGQSGTMTGAYTFVSTPLINSVTPSSGTTAGGILVTISGANFVNGANVSFGGVASPLVTFINTNTLRVVTPAHSAATVDVSVQLPGGNLITASGTYTYTNSVLVTAVAPSSGPTVGGTVVNVQGANFQPGAAVSFGGTAATAVIFNNSSSLSVTTPFHVVGTVNVTVTNPDSTNATLNSGYTFSGNLSVTSVLPNAGALQGGTTVTVNGTNFQPGATVTFGGLPALSVFVNSSTQMVVTTPPHAAGTVNVSVATPDGQNFTLGNGFTYATVSLQSVFPGSGPTTGGTSIQINGASFVPGMTVFFGGVQSPTVNVTNSTELQAVLPAHAAGTVNVTVNTPSGDTATLTNAFTYVLPLALNSINPTSGPSGTVVTLNGQSFQPTSQVLFGGIAAISVTYLNSSQIQAPAPPNPVGAVNVQVANIDGQTAVLPAAFTYTAPPPTSPTVTAVSPTSGASTGGTAVQIFGTNFKAGATVQFGAAFAGSVTVVSSTTITAVTPPGAPGPVTVTVTNTDNTSGGLGNAFTYNAVLSLSSVTPNTGPATGGTPFTLSGSNFQSGMGIFFNGVPATLVTLLSTSVAQGVTPANPAGTVNVSALNPDGSTATLPGAFAYTVVKGGGTGPTITNVVPNSGPVTGGTNVLISGSNFQAGTTVTFGGIAATNVNANTSSQLAATTPANAAGPADVTVTNPDGQTVTVPGAFTYIGLTLSSINPTTANTSGGPAITGTGTLFNANTQLFLNGVQVPVTINSSTQLTFTPPAHAAGSVDVTVRDSISGTTSTLPNGLTYSPPPTISNLSRQVGSSAGGTNLIINGTGFTNNATASFGGTPVTTLTFLSSTQLQVVTAAHSPAMVDVTVTTGGGSFTLPASFDYEPAPSHIWFNVDFENGTMGNFFNFSSGGALPTVVSTDVAHIGSRSVKCTVLQAACLGCGGVSRIEYTFTHPGEPPNPALSSPNGFYHRWYYYLTPGAITGEMTPGIATQTKLLLSRTSLGGSLGSWFMSGFGRNFGSNPLNQWTNEEDAGVDTPGFFPTNVLLQPNVWYEIETRFQRDPVTHTGVGTVWINGQLVTKTPPLPAMGTDDPTVIQHVMLGNNYSMNAANDLIMYIDDVEGADGFIEPVP